MQQILITHPEVVRSVGSKRVVAASTNKYGELFAVTTDGVTYDYLKCFCVGGDDVAVSLEARSVSAEKLITELLGDATKACPLLGF